ncbi:unnamed protein product [Cyclocybe aegerita]|uniref:Complex 1 LYR protein n=1 Tax=Cyclocybe aegerita TaxID=1973307 RepID=A0A8S0WVF0_CYCAE|nr:unnamed protein product [Cyclocybe aegerita]
MLANRTTLYRTLLRELRLSIEPPRRVNRSIVSHFRSIAEQLGSHDTPRARQDFENAILFLKSQREHKVREEYPGMSHILISTQKRLLERYNPLFDLTAQERIEATARRVGLNMPKTPEA